jgi:TRAP-type uncharacterized transport system substrate-binding protein
VYGLFRIPLLVASAVGFSAIGGAAMAQSDNPAAALWNKIKPAQEEPVQPKAVAKPQPVAPESPFRRQILQANENTISIISGNPNGSLLSIAYDIATVLDAPDGLRILPVVGKGTTQNLRDVMFMRGIDLGFVRSNTMSYYKGENEIPGLKDKIVYIAKLFNDEVHIYARSEIKSVKDLEGKRVNFSDVGSGTQFTSREIFKALGVKPVEVNLGQGDGLEAMRRNRSRSRKAEQCFSVAQGGRWLSFSER